MRPHRLRLQAFGPFPREVEVDLDALAGSGLFLLHGETGAGKTTLLDALGFALFGKVPGARGEQRLRCDTAPAEVRTQVQLEVTLSGRRFRITRSPAQARPKARGTGTTTEQARMQLEELRGGAWETVSTRIDEASAELEPLLGMSSEQFFQVVLLPQGEFARFLRSRSAERGALLQRLFGTGRFAAVEHWLAARRVSTATAASSARAGLRELASRVAQAAGVADVPEELPEQWEQGLLAAAEGAEAAAGHEVDAATTVRDAARQEADGAGALAGRQARRREAELAAAGLRDRQGEVERLAEEAQAAGRAAEVAAVLARAEDAEAERVRAAAQEAAARAALPAAGLPLDAAVEALREAAEAARRRSGRLEALRGTAAELAAEQAEQRTAEAEAGVAERDVAQHAAGLAALPPRRAAAVEERDAAVQADALLPAARARLALLEAGLGHARQLVTARAEHEVLRERALTARESAAAARDVEAALRQARLVTMLAELADRLAPGAPCEVCGSLEHPDPYEGAGEGVGQEAEERARAERERAEAEAARLATEAATAGAVVDAARARLEEAGLPAAVHEVAAQRDAAERDVTALERVAAARVPAQARVEALEAEQAALRADHDRRAADRDAAAQRAAAAGARAARLTARLSEELQGAPDLEAALQAVEHLAAAADAAASAAEDAARAGRTAAEDAAAAVSASVAAGFADPAAARAALRDEPWRAQAQRRQREHADALAAVTAQLADPELAVALAPAAPVAERAAALREADAALALRVHEAAQASARAAQLRALVPVLAAARAALAPLEEQAAQVRRLADLCAGSGANAYRMTLTSFVLAARLEEVAAAASTRLLRMTQGRYALVHTDGAARGGVRSGLGLLARDSWTGQDRDTATLSGGETFLASLALALGLADVVQAEAGGTRIEALFVDEGFGTLDEDTLDEVMDVLDGLREGGRVVGLVSHVAELRQRIPAQVRVSKSPAGSTLAVTGC